MLCLNLNTTNPFFNLAIDEYLLKNSEDEFLILGINEPSIIIGKHQVAHKETNTRYIYETGIPVIRRISGGGTVYHDRGNLNFTFILNSAEGKQVDFRKYTLPVIEFLNGIGIAAEFGGKNNLMVNGLKISGNAEHVFRRRVLHHGTLLVCADLDNLSKSLRKEQSAYNTRGVDSNPAKTLNICDIASGNINIEDFRSEMLVFFADKKGNSVTELKNNDIEKISEMERSKYRTWEWNYAYGPEYSFINSFEINGIKHNCNINVQDGIITGSRFEGSGEIMTLQKIINGSRHMVKDLLDLIHREKINIPDTAVYNFF